MKILSKTIQFVCDAITIHGILHLPPTPNPPLVIGSHGLEGTKESAKQALLADLLPGMGIAFFRFDHRGCGESDGIFQQDTSLDKRAADMVAAVKHVLSLGLTSRKIALFGSSLGGATCIEAWTRLEDQGLTPQGAVLCATPIKSETIKNIPLEGTEDRPALPISFFEENLLFDLTRAANRMDNLLLFHGSKDEVVPWENSQTLYDLARHPKELIIHENGDHRMSNKSQQEDFTERTAIWLKGCLLLD
ncbi:MAG: alpha/beta hydrolase [Desulfobacteraceae bacterium]|nr:alpha/beta hydrolase [Desulfobacteraceae bacterium]